ncbi:hypothetical protein CBER1_10853 [Cercospora berteroae]|uniref:Heterokaryon incompatibility domain-containing protein n=1 Tax=Cercospora berteroae TaxID=357750 RepID=A0A2S6BYP2_9PEZI|nr:hypothetical protein CBER1_10853 [Cercospora berteroae]
MRQLANRRPDNFEHLCLYLGVKDADIEKVEFFGLWDRVSRQLRHRTRRGFRVQVSEGRFLLERVAVSSISDLLADNPAASYIPTRPIDDEPGSSETFAKIAAWRSSCLQGHNGSCPHPSSRFMPRRLVEVQDSAGSDCLRLCETRDIGHSLYIALSYCWGNDQAVTSTTSTLSTWMESIPYKQLPQTLKDAVTVCRNLHVRFLWVDALCIIQDDDRDRSQQIAMMPQIYRNGHVTIAAASAADATEGFLRKRHLPLSETPAFNLPHVCPNSQRSYITLFCLEKKSNPLDARAWTMQERLLSPRTLEFSMDQVRWLCRGSLNQRGWTHGGLIQPEYDYTQPSILPREVFDRVFDIAQPLPEVDDVAQPRGAKEDWYRLVQAYTHRRLKRPTDRVLALSGLAKEYSAAEEDDYLAGMWRRSLLTELLWTVLGSKHPAPTAFQGPSWSWTSVNGVIDFRGQYGSWGPRTEEQVWAKVLHCHPILVEAGAPFGAVEEHFSSLTLEARLIPALLLPPTPPSDLKPDGEHHVIVMKSSDDCKMQSIKIDIDISDLAERTTDMAHGTTEVALLELCSRFTSSHWDVKGLVLRTGTISELQKKEMEQRLAVKAQNDSGSIESGPSTSTPTPSASRTDYLNYQIQFLEAKKNGQQSNEREAKKKEQQRIEPDENVFYRVGMFDYTSSYSQEAYNKSARRECDWFKYSVPRAVKIL